MAVAGYQSVRETVRTVSRHTVRCQRVIDGFEQDYGCSWSPGSIGYGGLLEQNSEGPSTHFKLGRVANREFIVF